MAIARTKELDETASGDAGGALDPEFNLDEVPTFDQVLDRPITHRQ